MMEYYQGALLANAAWGTGRQDTNRNSAKKPIAEFGDPDWSSKFHLWRTDWDENSIC